MHKNLEYYSHILWIWYVAVTWTALLEIYFSGCSLGVG